MLVTVDFETEGIERRPEYPPIPVGVAIKYPGKKGRYYAWGHPEGNNCTFEDAKAALTKAWQNTLLFQNAKFDVEVAEVHMGMLRKEWSDYHDTLYLIFLDDPHAYTYSLKPAAEKLLDMPPDEQDEVKDYLLAHYDVSLSNRSDKYWAKYICMAPGDLVGKYAIGDVVRTERIFNKLLPSIEERGMLEAYDRERELMLMLLENEQRGIPLDVKRLGADITDYENILKRVDKWLYNKLGVVINLNSGPQLMKAIIAAGLGDEDKLQYTPKGNVKSDKDSVQLCCKSKRLVGLLKYRTQLGTCLNTFMKPWYETASHNKAGVIYTRWNQVKGSESGWSEGTKTGRLSSSPNFQNIPNEFGGDVESLLKNLRPLPKVRDYVKPFPGDILIDRDYSQQELRILAHFEDGVLADAYTKNIWLDVHDYALKLINEKTGRDYQRKAIKNTGFGLLYGMGVGKLAVKSEITVAMAKEVKAAYLANFPGLKQMYADMKRRAKENEPITTWGGREYYCEPPAYVKGILCHFDYRMVNKLIQGSAADCTKEALVRWARVKPTHHKLIINVHDEIVLSVPKCEAAQAMETLRECMESVEFDIPILSEGKIGMTLASLTTYDKHGELV